MCGVSIGTVDRAINDRPGINPDTKQNILDTARKYGFVKNQNALTLSSGRSGSIGIIIFNLGSEYFTSLVTAVEDEAEKCGLSTVIMMTNYDAAAERACVKRLQAMNVAGVIVFSVLKEPDFYCGIIASGTPVVAVGNRIGEGIPYVGIDDFAAMEAGVRYVLERGYRRLVYVAPLLEKADCQNIGAQTARLEGFEAAMRDSGAESLVIDRYADYERILPELTCGETPTAFVCPSSVYALRCLALHGRRFALMSFDRAPTLDALDALTGCRLTCLSYSTEEIGRSAVRLIDGMSGDGETAHDVIVPFEIVEGNTV